MTFDNLNLHPKILTALGDAGYCKPTKIQRQAIPKIVEGRDIRASAQTGTGKTATFLLPALNRLAIPSPIPSKGARILILAPTRELALQITAQADKYGKYLNRIKTVCIVGGVPYPKQIRSLSRPYDILIATPGRLIDFINRGKVDFSRLEMLVLDEADRMLDMGFLEPVEQIVQETPSSRQMLLFSATLEGSVVNLSERLLDNPTEIIAHTEKVKHDHIEQKIYYTDDLNHKNRLLEHILQEEGVDYVIVFTSTKRHADQLTSTLRDKEYRAAALHGDMNQRQRNRTLTQLRNGKVKILVATDVAARGIDVQSITHVINYDLPNNVEDYVHRIGRTGRAGAKGTALSFVSGKDAFLVKKIEEFTDQQISVVEISGLEPRLKRSAVSNKRRSSTGRGPNRRFKSKAKSSRRRGVPRKKR